MLITQVIQAGIKWLLCLLIPGAGFIKAIMAIKDLIVFFVESAIMLIPAITETILALATGSVAGVAKAIEFGLSKLIALVINLFAKLIGLGGLSKKVQAIFKKIRKRVDKAINKILKKAKKAGRKLMSKLGFSKKTKGGEKNSPEKQTKIDKGLATLQQEEKKYISAGEINYDDAEKVAQKIKQQHPVFRTFKVVDGGARWDYEYTASPKVKVEGEKKKSGSERVLATKENKKLAIQKLDTVTLADIAILIDQAALDRYKKGPGDSYTSYIQSENETQEIDWPIKYLKRRASVKQGKADESFWIKKQFRKSAAKNEKQYNVRHLNSEDKMVTTPVIPDYITGKEIGDVKNITHQSYVNQLRAIYALSVKERKYFLLITRTDTIFSGTFPIA